MKKLIPLLFLTCALLISACSSESDKQEATESTTATETEQTAEGRTIDVYGIDQFKYVVKEKADGIQVGDSVQVNGEWHYTLTGIDAAPGEQLNIKLTTISQLPPTAMSHNWLLLQKSADTQAFATASSQAKDNGYVAPDMEDQVITETGMLGGGESKTISFSAPEETGDYPYLCTFPGHFTGGMKGIMTVSEMDG